MENKTNNKCPICNELINNSAEQCLQCGWLFANDANNLSTNDGIQSTFDYKTRYQYYTEMIKGYNWKECGFPEVPQIKPINCPVCNSFRFDKLSWDDLYCGLTPEKVFCTICGWHYDLDQIENPDKKNKSQSMTLNEHKVWYAKKLKDNPNYDYFEEEINKKYVLEPHPCPVCGKYEFKDKCCFEVCKYCGWEDDGSESNDKMIGANYIPFSEYKTRYERYLKEIPKYRWDKHGKP